MDREFTSKAQLVAYGQNIDAPSSVIYSSMVSRDSGMISFFIKSYNDIYICACDIGNAYLNVKLM